jgi:hypothetical protein
MYNNSNSLTFGLCPSSNIKNIQYIKGWLCLCVQVWGMERLKTMALPAIKTLFFLILDDGHNPKIIQFEIFGFMNTILNTVINSCVSKQR